MLALCWESTRVIQGKPFDDFLVSGQHSWCLAVVWCVGMCSVQSVLRRTIHPGTRGIYLRKGKFYSGEECFDIRHWFSEDHL